MISYKITHSISTKLFKRYFTSTRSNIPKINGAGIVFKKLVQHQVKDVFMYSGGAIMPLIDKFYNNRKINYYINTHEQNCGHSATGYAKSLGKPGIVITTSGPGLTNCITPMLDAQTDSTPLIVISGQVSLKSIGTDAFQEAPSVQLTKPFTKWSHLVTSIDELDETINKAFNIAMSGKKGVVHLDIPKCVLTDTITLRQLETNRKFIELIKIQKETQKEKEAKQEPYGIVFDDPYYEGNYYNIDKVADVINSSKKPILYIGQGCLHAKEELNEFIQNTWIPVTTTIHAKGIINDYNLLSLNWCGMHGSPAANYALQEADCIICIGARFDDRTTGNPDKYAPNAKKNKKIIHIDIEEKQFNKSIKSNLNLVSDSQDFLKYMIKRVPSKVSTDKWIERITDLIQTHPFKNIKPKLNSINTAMVIKSINCVTMVIDKFRENTLISTGVGNHQMMTYQFINGNYPKKIFSSGSLGVMGAGLPYAIGLQIANPEKLVIDIDGDSSFLMTMSDMKTIKEYNLPIKIAILNDGRQMMVNIWERLFFDRRYTATINKRNPNFAIAAESFGIRGFQCNNNTQLDKITEEFLKYDGPALCEYKVIPDICLPLVGPGKALDEMILFDDYHNTKNPIPPKFNKKDLPC